jgi:hypothetical protein
MAQKAVAGNLGEEAYATQGLPLGEKADESGVPSTTPKQYGLEYAWQYWLLTSAECGMELCKCLTCAS